MKLVRCTGTLPASRPEVVRSAGPDGGCPCGRFQPRTLGRRQIERLDEELECVAMRPTAYTTLQVADRARAQTGALGEALVRQSGTQTMALQKRAKCPARVRGRHGLWAGQHSTPSQIWDPLRGDAGNSVSFPHGAGPARRREW